ncbi:MAG: hypothetical protein ACI9HY_003075 [Planctomycetaceae bacterium]|jgi:hypothetical protein
MGTSVSIRIAVVSVVVILSAHQKTTHPGGDHDQNDTADKTIYGIEPGNGFKGVLGLSGQDKIQDQQDPAQPIEDLEYTFDGGGILKAVVLIIHGYFDVSMFDARL